VRDRLWFFSAGRYRDRATDFATITHNPCATPLSANCNINSTAIPYVRGDQESRWELKLTSQLAENHSVVASYLDKKRYLTNNQFTTNIYDTASLSLQDTPEHLLSLHYTGVLHRDLLVEGQYSQRELAFENSGSQYTDLIRGTLMINAGVTPNARFASPTFCGTCDTETRSNDSILLKTSYFLTTKSSAHTTSSPAARTSASSATRTISSPAATSASSCRPCASSTTSSIRPSTRAR
jgi:hypothetical protein